ncbi:chaperone protein HscA homolog [Culicoides brevitarsis]|uniref:chaperone protein HscA homolog n=1 Tax=Culicoides brevitarsis TaxID=469753 RepID=UPI00307C485D
MEKVKIAIDIGSTKIVAAVCDENGKAHILTDDQANRFMIACVGFTDRQRLFGFAADCQGTVNPKNTIYGRDLKLLQEQRQHEFSPLRLSQDRSKALVVLVDYRKKTEVVYPEELLAMLLSKVKINAENSLKTEVESCVLTIPAAFSTQKRSSFELAAKIAGFHDVQMLNDTTAAAITYAMEKNSHPEGHNVLIFDIGATSTEASIVFVTKNGVFVKANAAEMNLGGENFVNTLVEYFLREFRAETKINLAKNEQIIARLRVGCEKLKKALSTGDTAKVTLESFYNGIPYDLIMTREIFELHCAEHFTKIMGVARKLFHSTLIQKSDVAATILVGGGGRIPKIQQDLKAFMHGGELSRILNQDEAVATGAAYFSTNSLRVEELPRLNSLFGNGPLKDLAKMQQVLRRFDEDEVALLEQMAQINDLEKLCYSYKRAVVKQGVEKGDEQLVVEKCNEILASLEHLGTGNFDRNDFRRHSKELKELYSLVCNKNHEINNNLQENPNVNLPKNDNFSMEEQEMKQIYAVVNKKSSFEPPKKVEIKEIHVDVPIKADSGQEFYDQGVALFVAQNYKDALEIFTYFIQQSKQQLSILDINELYSYRAKCHFYLKNYEKFRQDVNQIPRNRRSQELKVMTEQAARIFFIARAKEALNKIRLHQRDAPAIEVSLSILTSVIDIRPKPMKTFEEQRLTSKLLHSRSILNFQMRRYAQAIQDSYQNTKIIHSNPDFHDERQQMYDELIPYLKTTPKTKDLYKNFGGQTCEEFNEVSRCVKESKKTKKRGLFYCCGS